MKPFRDAYPELAQHAAKIIETAKLEQPDSSKSPDMQTRLQRASHVKLATKSFSYNHLHQMWNVQSVSQQGRRSIFTATNSFCTCPDNSFGEFYCKHLIALADAVLKYENK